MTYHQKSRGLRATSPLAVEATRDPCPVFCHSPSVSGGITPNRLAPVRIYRDQLVAMVGSPHFIEALLGELDVLRPRRFRQRHGARAVGIQHLNGGA